MKLKITGMNTNDPTQPGPDGTFAHAGSQGGTEMMAARIRQEVDPELLKNFNIIHSRVRNHMIDPNKHNILVLHDTWDDPEADHLRDPKSRARFRKLVFVSNHQLATYNMGLGVPYAESMVLQNAIDPIEVRDEDKVSDKIRVIYHTTPHRGLELLVPVFDELTKIHGDKIHLDVYSSFKAYGWEQRDQPYELVFNHIRHHPNMTYHGFQPNSVVREALKKSHIYAYPCIWPETSCISVIEAMSARCHVVTSNLAALPETCANFATMYQYDEDPNRHANMFAHMLNVAIHQAVKGGVDERLKFQKVFFDNYYGWTLRKAQWNAFLNSLLS